MGLSRPRGGDHQLEGQAWDTDHRGMAISDDQRA